MINLLVITADDKVPEHFGTHLKESRGKIVSLSPGPQLPDWLYQDFFSCVLIDSRLPDFARYLSIIREVSPLSAVITLYDHETRLHAIEALNTMAWAALPLDASPVEIDRTIHSTMEHLALTNFGLSAWPAQRFPTDDKRATALIMHLAQAVLMTEHTGLVEQSKLSELFITVFLRVLKTMLGCEKVSVILPEKSHEDVLIMLRDTSTSYEPVTVRLKERGQVTTYILDHSEPILVKNIETDRRFYRKNKIYYHTPSFISLPVTIGKRTMAIINATDKENHQQFTRDDLDCAARLVNVIETAFSRQQKRSPNWMEDSFLVEQMSQKTNLLRDHLFKLREELEETRTDLTRRETEISAIYTADEKIRETLVLEELLMMVTDLVVTVMMCDKSSVLLLGERDNTDILVRGSRKIINHKSNSSTKLQVRGKVTSYILETGSPLLVTDENKREDLFAEETTRYRTHSFVSVPVYLEGHIVAIVNATDKISGDDFNSEDLKLLEFLASQISKSMEKFELTKHLVYAQQVENELKIAAGLQKSILPRSFPRTKDIQVVAYNRPAREMGGDFYDIFVLPDGRLAVLIADVTGKGIPAAFYSALVLSHIKALCARYRSPRTIGAKTNRFLFDLDPDSTMFVTMFLGILDQKTGKLTYVSAGHEPAILLRRDRRIELLESKGLMLGIFEESILKQKTVILEPNDLLVVYTDGLTDAHDEKKNRLDREKIERLLLQKNPQSAQRAVDLLVKFVTDHSQNAPQFDDITILTVYRES